jgi:hypothetical protein
MRYWPRHGIHVERHGNSVRSRIWKLAVRVIDFVLGYGFGYTRRRCDGLMPLGARGAEGQERKRFFFEKKNQKTFDYIRLMLPHRAHQQPKVFGFFFQKEALCCFGRVSLNGGRGSREGAEYCDCNDLAVCLGMERAGSRRQAGFSAAAALPQSCRER